MSPKSVKEGALINADVCEYKEVEKEGDVFDKRELKR